MGGNRGGWAGCGPVVKNHRQGSLRLTVLRTGMSLEGCWGPPDGCCEINVFAGFRFVCDHTVSKVVGQAGGGACGRSGDAGTAGWVGPEAALNPEQGPLPRSSPFRRGMPKLKVEHLSPASPQAEREQTMLNSGRCVEFRKLWLQSRLLSPEESRCSDDVRRRQVDRAPNRSFWRCCDDGAAGIPGPAPQPVLRLPRCAELDRLPTT